MARSKRETTNNVEGAWAYCASVDCSYDGTFAESVRIATILHVLVHETGKSKPLLKQAQPNGLDLPILDARVSSLPLARHLHQILEDYAHLAPEHQLGAVQKLCSASQTQAAATDTAHADTTIAATAKLQ